MSSDEARIEEVRKHPLLYNLALADYKNLKKKDYAWKDVTLKTKVGEEQCKKRWKALQDSYKRCKRHMDTLSFLDSVESFRGTVGNIDIEEMDDSTQSEKLSESTVRTPETPSSARKQNDSSKFEQFLELASESITKTCNAFAEQPENTTALFFKGFASKITEANMPFTERSKLESKVSALVFSEIQKFKEAL